MTLLEILNPVVLHPYLGKFDSDLRCQDRNNPMSVCPKLSAEVSHAAPQFPQKACSQAGGRHTIVVLSVAVAALACFFAFRHGSFVVNSIF